MVGISPERDGNGFQAYLLPTHPVKASHPSGWIYNPFFLPQKKKKSNKLTLFKYLITTLVTLFTL